MPTLQLGASGSLVSEIQSLINYFYSASVVAESGTFDAATAAAVKRVQKDLKLPPTGIVNDSTLSALQTKYIQADFRGKTYYFTQSQFAEFTKQVRQMFKKTSDAYTMKAQEARILWKSHTESHNNNKFFAFMVDEYAGIELPPESIISAAEAGAKKIAATVSTGSIGQIEGAIDEGHEAIKIALQKMSDYRNKMYAGAENLIDDLNQIKDGCVIILEVTTVIATGGASVGVTAAVMGGFGAYKGVLSEIDSASKAPKVDITAAFGRVLLAGVIDGSVGALLHNEGMVGGLTEGLAKKMSGAAAKKFGNAVIKDVVEVAIKNASKNGLDEGFKAAVSVFTKAMDPKGSITLKQAATEIAGKMALGAVLGGIEKGVGDFTGSYTKYFTAADFKGLGNVKIDDGLRKGGLAIIEQAMKKGVGQDVLTKAAATGDTGGVAKGLAEAIKDDDQTMKALQALLDKQKPK